MNEPIQSLAAAATALNASCGRKTPFALAFLTDRTRIADPLAVAAALPAEAAVILRDYDMAGREMLALALAEIAAERRLVLVIGGDVELARRVGAGLHLRSDQVGRMKSSMFPTAVAGGGFHQPDSPPILIASCHSAAELARAAELGADLALLGPVFATKSHPSAQPLGVAAFKALAAASPIPVLALGGVKSANAGLLGGRNVAGIAAIGAFSAIGNRQSAIGT